MKVSRARLLLLFIGLSGLILVIVQSTSGERKPSASDSKSLLDHLRRTRVAEAVEVPAGTRLHVRLKERITDKNRAGEIFVGKLDRDLEQSEKLAAPRGSRVIGRITQLGEDKERSSSTEVGLILEQIVVGKKAFPVKTLPLTLSTPASAPLSDGSGSFLRGPAFLPRQSESNQKAGKEETIYEAETRLTFVLAELLRLPVFVRED